ncbi:glycosyltransferase family 2 protein [Pseudonocardia sp.]|uniref:glycosyltransferase family 2 protein n=1 Tax=Pseudonocardia sp. TaxID=60912 RepID=UPI002612A891|nr:glycosyltransferase family 2 protein [Pseudonocardia sp.]
MSPAVDVAVPCYKYGKMLPTAVRSILDQEGVDVRVLVIDDSSGDGSADVAHRLAAEDDRVTVRVHEQNRGHIATFTEGAVEWPEAAYGLLISADDALTPGALARATALMEAHPSVGLVYGNVKTFHDDEPLPPADIAADPNWAVHEGHTWLRRRLVHADNVVSTPTAVFRTAVQRAVGGYNPETYHTSDFEMWMRFALVADIGFVGGVDQGYIRVHGSNMSAPFEREDAGVRALPQRLAALLSAVDHGRDTLPDAADLERRMRRTLAKEALVLAGRSYDKGRVDERINAQLVAFATEVVDDVTTLPQWRSLRVRQALGPRFAPALSPLVVTAAGRRVRQAWRDRRLRLEGV